MSNGTTKPIRLSSHAQGYLARRGFTEAEVAETIRTETWAPARGGRWEASRVFPYNGMWNGTFYFNKRVRPVFVEKTSGVVVVTVYTYFF